MILTLILGMAAGAGAPYLEDHVKRIIEGVALAGAPLSAVELRVATFALLLFGAAILAWVFGNGSAMALSLGAVLGVAAPRIIAAVQNRKTPDYGEDE